MHKNGDIHQLNLFLFINIDFFFFLQVLRLIFFLSILTLLLYFLHHVLLSSLFILNRTRPANIHVTIRDRLEYLVCLFSFFKLNVL